MVGASGDCLTAPWGHPDPVVVWLTVYRRVMGGSDAAPLRHGRRRDVGKRHSAGLPVAAALLPASTCTLLLLLLRSCDAATVAAPEAAAMTALYNALQAPAFTNWGAGDPCAGSW